MMLPAGKKRAMLLGSIVAPAASLLALALPACGTGNGSVLLAHTTPAAPPVVAVPARSGAEIELYSWFDLPNDDARARELSGIAWDDATHTLWGVQDESANIVPLVPDRDLKK